MSDPRQYTTNTDITSNYTSYTENVSGESGTAGGSSQRNDQVTASALGNTSSGDARVTTVYTDDTGILRYQYELGDTHSMVDTNLKATPDTLKRQADLKYGNSTNGKLAIMLASVSSNPYALTLERVWMAGYWVTRPKQWAHLKAGAVVENPGQGQGYDLDAIMGEDLHRMSNS
jgi:hypothetical protein